MQPPVAGGLRIADDAELVQQGLDLRGREADIREVGARLRVEIQAQLVAMLGVRGAIRPDVKTKATEVDSPDHVREVGDHERARLRAVDRRHRRRPQPLGRVLRNALLEERRSLRALGEALHEHGATAHRPQQRLADAQVVIDEIALGLSALGEEHLVGTGEPDLTPGDLKDLSVVAGHERTVPTRPPAQSHASSRDTRSGVGTA